MSDVTFTIYYDGKFETLSDNTVMYKGGFVNELVTPARALFQGLPVSLYGQRVWYKLPFEDMSALKIMCEGVDNFEKMCEAARWIRFVEIYMERDEDLADEEEGRNNITNSILGDDHCEQQINEEERREDRNEEEEEREENDICAEEVQVEELVANFVDEEENDDYQRTPPMSDEEGGEIRSCGYDRWKRGSGKIQISQVFESVKEFRDVVLEYALFGGFNIRFNMSEKLKCSAVCGIKNCSWRVYCSYEKSISMWMIKTFQEEHTCYTDGRCMILSQQVICDMFIHELRNDPLLKPIVMQTRIHEKYNVAPSFDQCRKAKKQALDLIEEEFNKQYARIKDYRDELKARNPHSTVEVRTEMNEKGTEVFDSFYMCFSGLRDTWKDHCRPIFGIDGCFLKSDSKRQLLAAIGRDANNQIYPFAWAVVQVENAPSWSWFIRHLKNDLGLGNGDGFTVISDRQKGLLKAVNEELPKIEHRMCARHIYANIKKVHPKKSQMKTLFWEVVESFNEADYESNLAKLKKYDVAVYEAFMSRNPRNCSRAFFKTHSCCEDALNNFSEAYNSTLEKARAMPLIQSLETMRRQAMVRIAVRRKKAHKLKGKHTLKVADVIAEEDKHVKNLRIVPGRPGLFEVYEKGHGHKVNMKDKTCVCRRWDLTGIPCRHALRVVFDNPRTYNREDLVSDNYLASKLQVQYLESIGPVNGEKFWSKGGESRLETQPREVHKGRNKKPQKRLKSVTESPTKGKRVTNHGRDMYCYRCGIRGHYSSKCPNAGVPFKPRPPKKSANTAVPESQELPGPSQPSQ